MDAFLTICCLKKGNKYGPGYVNILEWMVRRNVVSTPYDFVCFTDDAAGIRPEIRTEPLPFDAPEWWGKMGLYMPAIPGIHTERLLFLDLDVVIIGPLDELMRYESDFAMARDEPAGAFPPGDKRDRAGNSSVILLRVGAAAQIWKRYKEKGHAGYGPYGDQEWVNREFPGLAELLPERFVQSYKLHKLAGEDAPNCDVVMFHGLPKPPDCGGWVKEYWHE
jgi:hypothetical protein